MTKISDPVISKVKQNMCENLAEDLPKNAKTAKAILVKDQGGYIRYFVKFDHDKLVAAWSLAGAKLFLGDCPKLSLITSALLDHKYQFEILEIGVLSK